MKEKILEKTFDEYLDKATNMPEDEKESKISGILKRLKKDKHRDLKNQKTTVTAVRG